MFSRSLGEDILCEPVRAKGCCLRCLNCLPGCCVGFAAVLLGHGW